MFPGILLGLSLTLTAYTFWCRLLTLGTSAGGTQNPEITTGEPIPEADQTMTGPEPVADTVLAHHDAPVGTLPTEEIATETVVEPSATLDEAAPEAEREAFAVDGEGTEAEHVDLAVDEEAPDVEVEALSLNEAPQALQWYVIRLKSGQLRASQSRTRTPLVVAGPFPTKEAAHLAKERYVSGHELSSPPALQ